MLRTPQSALGAIKMDIIDDKKYEQLEKWILSIEDIAATHNVEAYNNVWRLALQLISFYSLDRAHEIQLKINERDKLRKNPNKFEKLDTYNEIRDNLFCPTEYTKKSIGNDKDLLIELWVEMLLDNIRISNQKGLLIRPNWMDALKTLLYIPSVMDVIVSAIDDGHKKSPPKWLTSIRDGYASDDISDNVLKKLVLEYSKNQWPLSNKVVNKKQVETIDDVDSSDHETSGIADSNTINNKHKQFKNKKSLRENSSHDDFNESLAKASIGFEKTLRCMIKPESPGIMKNDVSTGQSTEYKKTPNNAENRKTDFLVTDYEKVYDEIKTLKPSKL